MHQTTSIFVDRVHEYPEHTSLSGADTSAFFCANSVSGSSASLRFASSSCTITNGHFADVVSSRPRCQPCCCRCLGPQEQLLCYRVGNSSNHQQFLLLIRIWLGAHNIALEPLRCQVGQREACLQSQVGSVTLQHSMR